MEPEVEGIDELAAHIFAGMRFEVVIWAFYDVLLFLAPIGPFSVYQVLAYVGSDVRLWSRLCALVTLIFAPHEWR